MSKNLVRKLGHKERASVRVQSAFGRNVEGASKDNEDGQKVGRDRLCQSLHARQEYDNSLLEYQNWEPLKDLEQPLHCGYVFERPLKEVGKLGQTHF